jgi:peptidoglycan/xylan/chitin deacetylase (PgdA/CDA1 family)
MRTVAILAYHKVGEPAADAWETWYYVPEPVLRAQLGWLGEHGWQAIDAVALVEGLALPEGLPERSVLITFDDAYRSVLDCALPPMRELSLPGVVFTPTAFIGGTSDFDADTSEPVAAVCDWDELRELEAGAVSVQSHGVSHRAFSDLGITEIESELARSREALEQGLGRAVELFSFPYGDVGVDEQATSNALARTGYRAAFLYGGGPARLPTAAPYRLERVAMWPDTDLVAELGAY